MGDRFLTKDEQRIFHEALLKSATLKSKGFRIHRCEFTGNPYGTDTMARGVECLCKGCIAGRAALREREGLS